MAFSRREQNAKNALWFAASVFATLLVFDLFAPVAHGQTLVYTRQPNNQTKYSDAQGTIDEGSNWQLFVDDAGRPRGPTTTSDVVTQTLGSRAEVIHNCTLPEVGCAATYGRPSPDGTRILYTVFNLDELTNIKAWDGPMTDIKQGGVTTAELWMYDIATKKSTRLTSGHVDAAGDWINNNKIVFSCDRSGNFPAWGLYGVKPSPWYSMRSWHICSADLNGTTVSNIKDLTPHEQMAMTPMVTSSGFICYNTWIGYGDKSINISASRNMWPVVCMNQDGSGTFGEFAMHGGPKLKTLEYILRIVDPNRHGEGSTTLKVTRAVSEIAPGVMCATNYYNGQSTKALGAPICWGFDANTEGVRTSAEILGVDTDDRSTVLGSGRYLPSTTQVRGPTGTDQDTGGPKFHRNGKAMGRAGYAAPWLLGGKYKYIQTSSPGWCSQDALLLPVTRAAMGGVDTCRPRIYGVLVDQVTDPFDLTQMEPIACAGPKWACWDGRVVAPYQAIMGRPEPVQQVSKLSGTKCHMAVFNATLTDLNYIPGAPEYMRVQAQGNILLPDYPAKVKALFAEKITMHKTAPTPPSTDQAWVFPATHQRVFPAREVVAKQPLMDDGSVLMEVPCETPLLAGALDVNGKVVAYDLMLQSLRTGETRTCCGCHAGHAEGSECNRGNAEAFFKTTQAAAAVPTPPGC